jgi:predicted nucleic acid-binding protein
MPGSLTYLDSSALVKLILREPATNALRTFLPKHPFRVSSTIAVVEVVRAVTRARSTPVSRARAAAAARDVLRRIGLIELDADILRTASQLESRDLRTLDALHLASALSLGGDLDVMVAYDARLAAAARLAGVAVASPS